MSELHIEKGSGSIRGMNIDGVRDIARYAYLPDILQAAEEQGTSREEAEKSLVDSLKSEGLDLKIVSVGKYTAFVATNTQTNEIIVSFDPNISGFSRQFGPKEHPLGGKVFGGVINALTKENENENGLFVDKLKEAIIESAETLDGSATLEMAGFSKAGAIAVGATGWFMAEGFFKENPNINMTRITSFGSFPCGNKEFSQNFMQEANRMGIEVFRITGGDADPTPTYFTDDAPLFLDPPGEDYVHVGTQIDLHGVTEHDMGVYIDALYTPQSLDAMITEQGVITNFPEHVPEKPLPLGI